MTVQACPECGGLRPGCQAVVVIGLDSDSPAELLGVTVQQEEAFCGSCCLPLDGNGKPAGTPALGGLSVPATIVVLDTGGPPVGELEWLAEDPTDPISQSMSQPVL